MEWGATLIFERKLGVRERADLAAMGSAEEDFHTIAEKARVKPWSQFTSLHRRAYLSADMEPPPGTPEEPIFFSAREGLLTVRALLEADASAFQDHIDMSAVRTGLGAWEKQLEEAAKDHVGFRYESFEL